MRKLQDDKAGETAHGRRNGFVRLERHRGRSRHLALPFETALAVADDFSKLPLLSPATQILPSGHRFDTTASHSRRTRVSASSLVPGVNQASELPCHRSFRVRIIIEPAP